jgi:hypothetical protein
MHLAGTASSSVLQKNTQPSSAPWFSDDATALLHANGFRPNNLFAMSPFHLFASLSFPAISHLVKKRMTSIEPRLRAVPTRAVHNKDVTRCDGLSAKICCHRCSEIVVK